MAVAAERKELHRLIRHAAHQVVQQDIAQSMERAKNGRGG